MFEDIAVDVEGCGFDFWADQIRRSVSSGSPPFLRSCVAQALSREDGPRHSLHATA